MELNVAFSCPCGAFFDQNIHVDTPELSTDPASDRDEEFFASLQCDGCGKDFEAQITRKFGEASVSIDGAVSLTFDVLVADEDDELRWIIESSEQLDTYRDVLRNAYRLLQAPVAEDLKASLCNMIYAQVVTAVEAYLSGTFIRTVVNSDMLIRKLVMTDPALANRPLLLKDMFSQLEGLKLTVAKYLQDLIFHDLKKVKPMYASVLDIDFGDIGWLFKAVLIRHDCVHRNGVSKEGEPTGVDEPAIVELIRNCSSLVVDIDQQIQFLTQEVG
ncbi:hypothetical protein BZM27_30470 [Paraburkholderia steynii]|uniref:RiboL-PSP-HEPN domain-containing protein n=1 Tax=Paraburkholderia steynii TaxID=1245441 RepID=A0A4R0X6M2_9BURK|nr:hypothetical protein BZM27_30470 [Paraburkholderia steynii]